MAEWKPENVNEVVQAIKDDSFVLPVIQRRLICDEEKMALLFNSLFKGYSFGAIIGLVEKKNNKPLFAFRKFSIDGTRQDSLEVDKLNQNQFFVIDGQQRLQSFYIGLSGTFNEKNMYFDLYSDYQILDYDFKFTKSNEDMPASSGTNSERAERKIVSPEIDTVGECFWYKVKKIYERLLLTNNHSQVSNEIINEYKIDVENKKTHIQENIQKFYEIIFQKPAIGISKVVINYSKSDHYNRQFLVELFRRLNSAGTVLSTLDLVASRLKGFDYRMEKFLDDFSDNDDFKLTQDEIIKLLMLFKDKPLSDVTEFNADVSKFAVENSERIKTTLKVLHNLLIMTGDYDWFTKIKNRSPLPLYLLAYYISFKK